MDQDEVSEFLEHFGVKGMRWGVRRAELNDKVDQTKTAYKDAKSERNQFRLQTAKKVGVGVAAAGAIAVGLYAANAVLKKHGGKPAAKLPKAPEKLWQYEWKGTDGNGKAYHIRTNSKEAYDFSIAEMMRRTANYG